MKAFDKDVQHAKDTRDAILASARAMAKTAVWDDAFIAEDPLTAAAAWGTALARKEEAAWKAFDEAVIVAKAARNAVWNDAFTPDDPRAEEAAWKVFDDAVDNAKAERDASLSAAKATRNAIRKAAVARAVARKEEAAWKAFFEDLRME